MWHFWGGVKTYSDPSYIFSGVKTPLTPGSSADCLVSAHVCVNSLPTVTCIKALSRSPVERSSGTVCERATRRVSLTAPHHAIPHHDWTTLRIHSVATNTASDHSSTASIAAVDKSKTAQPIYRVLYTNLLTPESTLTFTWIEFLTYSMQVWVTLGCNFTHEIWIKFPTRIKLN